MCEYAILVVIKVNGVNSDDFEEITITDIPNNNKKDEEIRDPDGYEPHWVCCECC